MARSSMQIARTCSTALNSNAPKKEYQLMREWIQDSLYNPEKGYFMQRADIINNRADKKFYFSVVPSLQGREEYIKEVSKWFRYDTRKISILIFYFYKPHDI
jgi:hypothetical protein